VAHIPRLLLRTLLPRRDTRIPGAAYGATLNRQTSRPEKLSGALKVRELVLLRLPVPISFPQFLGLNGGALAQSPRLLPT
jgi:hypothetical protein